MAHVLGQERSSGPRQNVHAVREKTPLPWIEKAMLLPGKHRVRHSFSQPYHDRGFDFTENVSAEKVQSRSSGNERKPRVEGRACDDNELVKHMSNLPGFLQHVEKDNTVQDKALNFGVLDWTRLEKWKYTERMPGKLPRKASPTRDSFVSASGLPKISLNLKNPSSRTRYPSLSHSGKQPVADGPHFSSPQQQQPPQSLYVKSSKEERNGKFKKEEEINGKYQKEEEYVEYLKPKGKETCNQKYHMAESIRIARQQNHFQQMEKYSDQICSETSAYKSKRNPQKEMMSEREASSSSSKQRKQKIALPLSPNKVKAHGKESEMRFDEVKVTSKCPPAKPQNIVLLVPKDFQEKSCSENSQVTESRTSLDAQLLAVTGNRLSDFCSPQELYSGGYSADIPHSCPLPSSAMEPHDLLASHATDADICPKADSTTYTSEAKFSNMIEETIRPSAFIEASSRKQAGDGEQPTAKGRSPSPTRRFSFNLGRMGRSLSFKESSAVPQLSSTYTPVKSGPVRSVDAHSMDSFDRDQANSSSKARSSPLRRLLDPLLRHKTGSDAVRPLNGSLRSVAASPTGIKGPPQDRKPDASTFQALLQLTFKNGLPFFRLVVENRKDMLAAAVKRLPTSEKVDPCMIYSFYSVHEIKKKSMNWISHGSKSKTCSLGYSIIGQMKISNIYHLKANRGDTGECDARECVLYGVDPGEVDKQMLAFVPNKEIAAIVVKDSSKRVDGGEFIDKNQRYEGRNFPRLVSPATSESQEKANSNGTVVILPGAVHGLPIKGAPSSLINRWRSGGSCDCGGWDVGCKLRVLADSRKSSNSIQESTTSSSVDHVNLFMQGGEQKGRPVFSLKPFSDEFYSIEMDPSISLLEAFATSVAYLTSRKIPEIIDGKGESEAEHVPGADNRRKTASTSFKEQIPAKYVTCPPLSPVGRI
ncbi:uncharacterized protein LOC130996765 [Salvia miltiorrhiza]|uniref:uncharacterized protein LOC130996765 n=1 Tax=Salvia miltiorrhiza TaxID=226208 RepID=UPI0025AD17A2|nr:uncharacterized protein LOC130996765 [Salvia miltiorrhiza]XP_057778043.1 uncharacterized protein LOC130996765 [Salvia miltiorrhiza]XP_057778044.1 uncharacterized protein LOC130996765 [Salvia miltiorrhiza]XP_057778045.1 uncharacterized protein LOC130996765 [Salvia miltiorrhiza]